LQRCQPRYILLCRRLILQAIAIKSGHNIHLLYIQYFWWERRKYPRQTSQRYPSGHVQSREWKLSYHVSGYSDPRRSSTVLICAQSPVTSAAEPGSLNLVVNLFRVFPGTEYAVRVLQYLLLPRLVLSLPRPCTEQQYSLTRPSLRMYWRTDLASLPMVMAIKKWTQLKFWD